MLRKRPLWRIASIVPSTNSLRRSTLCLCQRRLRPSVFTVTVEITSVTVANSFSQTPSIIRPLGVARGDPPPREKWEVTLTVAAIADDGGVVHRADAPGVA